MDLLLPILSFEDWICYCQSFYLRICSNKSNPFKYKRSGFLNLELIMIKHVIEGIAELIRHLLNLELFTVNLVLNVINPEVEENITLHNLDYSFPLLICPWFLKNQVVKNKNQVRKTGFLACKNQFRNWFLQATQAVKIQFEIE